MACLTGLEHIKAIFVLEINLDFAGFLAPIPRMTHLFASPPPTTLGYSGAALQYPSSTPYPSRTNTPAFSVPTSSNSSDNSYARKQSIRWQTPWKSSSQRAPKRSQTAPWKGSDPMAYYGYYQQQAPGWGSAAEYQPLPPPMPTYHPASNCEFPWILRGHALLLWSQRKRGRHVCIPVEPCELTRVS